MQNWIWGGGARIVGDLPFDSGEHPEIPAITMLGNSTYANGVGFGSRHHDVVVIATCDGAVRQLHRDINWFTLYELAGRADGGAPT